MTDMNILVINSFQYCRCGLKGMTRRHPAGVIPAIVTRNIFMYCTIKLLSYLSCF